MNNRNIEGYRVLRETFMSRSNPFVFIILFQEEQKHYTLSLRSSWMSSSSSSSSPWMACWACQPALCTPVLWQRRAAGDSWDCQWGGADAVLDRLQAWRLERDWQRWDVDSKHLLQGRFMSQWSAGYSVPRCHSGSVTRQEPGHFVKYKRSQQRM